MSGASVAPPAERRPEGDPAVRRLFGTDGVRGPVGDLITPELALALGRAVVSVTDSAAPRVLVVRDTRESGPMLEGALSAGIAAGGGHALLGGVLPTPACALLVTLLGLDLGAVVSASHNPYGDNGIKFFGAAADYLRALETRFARLDLSGRRILLDCANGAAHRLGPEIFRRLGAEIEVLADAPDGRNINAGCGSTHIEALGERVAAGGFHVGFALDGDADRVLAADRRGEVVDGDELIALAALHLRAEGRLAGNGVAVTVMTNYGFHRAMEAAGVEVATTAVGDRNVLLELVRRGWALGGEQSGHIIDTGFAASGDGVAAALLALEALGGSEMAERDAMEKLPQCLTSVRVRDREAVQEAAAVWAAAETEDRALDGEGRVLIRPSGTEPVVRVMVEAPTPERCQAALGRLVGVVERELA